MRIDSEQSLIHFDEFDQHVAGLPTEAPLTHLEELFEMAAEQCAVAKQYRESLEDELLYVDMGEQHEIELDNLDSQVRHLDGLSQQLGALLAPTMVDELIASVRGPNA